MKKKKLSLSRSLLWIAGSAIVVNGLAFAFIATFRTLNHEGNDELEVPIKAIVQTGPQKEALNTTYLAELLDLSANRPILSSTFDVKQARARLLESPVIKQAEVKLDRPGILYIDYTTRQPVALLGDFENVALDANKTPFPLAPFFTPKRLPEIYLGDADPIEWNTPIAGEKIDLAYSLLETLTGPIVDDFFNVRRIDVSNAFEPTLGKREIVLLAEDELHLTSQGRPHRLIVPRVLRFSTRRTINELNRYVKLRKDLLEKESSQFIPNPNTDSTTLKPKIIDFRIEQLAFIEEIPN